MRKLWFLGCAAIIGGSAILAAQDAAPKPSEAAGMKMPEPQKEHEWLKQYVGEWDAEVEMFMEPGKPPEKAKASESVRSIGGFWILAENKGMFQGQPFTGILTLGYDPEKKKYVGTWFDSMTSYLWTYRGSVEPDGKTLTLHTEGPSPHQPGKVSVFKEVTEFKSKDHKVFTSSMRADDGTWSKVMTINYRRKS